MKVIGIYKITNPKSKVYIGQSINIKERWRHYRKLRCKNQTKLYRSFKKYGVDAHKFEVITTCDVEELNEFERYYQEAYRSVENGLNCIYQECETRRYQFTEEFRLKMSLMKKLNPPAHVLIKGVDNLRSDKYKLINKYTKEVFIGNRVMIQESFKCCPRMLSDSAKRDKTCPRQLEDWDIYLDGKLIEVKYKKRPLILNLENGVYYDNMVELAKAECITLNQFRYRLDTINKYFKYVRV